ncbi:hypothetical protein F4820DRAFT_156597 [Hypoxylon rubiginosum]|uniref:Uncharacterized protein n=1 Tax=Hypoxylon rubiginosum TaxID=110542 RepID=A0ACB9YKV4_9PEZI|nr:hypothetical protein F4820DRAFT_156597 [Hypoxylon rubiginosum]
MATNGSISRDTGREDQFIPSSATSATHSVSAIQPAEQSSSTSPNSNLGKDEVAWFFVEQYYTTLSKNPEKLHLFYSKRSQFVYGLEAEIANVSVGRGNIQERIKQLDFQDCKVRVSNVDSQASFDNIVIQVIGETSNKAGDPKKFVQTFVLAQQPSGYFVLNDILRYIDEEDEEPAEAAQEEQAEPEAQPVPETKEEPEAQPTEPAEKPTAFDADIIDEKLEEASVATKDVAPTNGDVPVETAASETAAAPEPAKPEPEAVPVSDPEVAAQEVAEEESKEPEKPADPSPTPVQARQPPPAAAAAPAPAAPTPSQPPKPMTWASRAAAAAGPRPVVPLSPRVVTPVAGQLPRPGAATQPAAAPQASAPAPSSETAAPAAPAKETATEWQTAGGDSKRQNRPQSISGPQGEKDGTMGYVKYVTEKVKNDDLRAALAQHGELVYFDINRQKNCAFVEFSTAAGYQAAVAANPHVVNGENIMVEPRRPKAGAYGGSNYTAGRGNMQSRPGRGGFDGRAGSQGGRGNFGGQGRGRGGGAPRGRSTTQAANA